MPEATLKTDSRRGGRPPKSDEEKRSKTLSIRLTADEHHTIIINAKNAGMKPSIFVRKLAFEGKILVVPEINRKTWAELGKIGGLLKVFIKQVRDGKVDRFGDRFVAWAHRLFADLDQLRNEVRGK